MTAHLPSPQIRGLWISTVRETPPGQCWCWRGLLSLVGKAGSPVSRAHRRLVNRKAPKKSQVYGRGDLVTLVFSQMTLNPSTPSIQWRTSLLQKNINIFKEYTPAKQTELPVEPHLSHPFSGEAWRSPAPQEKDGPPLLRWPPNPNPCMRAPAVFLQCSQPRL